MTRLEDGSLVEAVSDDHRSGRTRKLSENELESFEETVHELPTEAGYDEPAWTTDLVKHHLSETYDVDYSLPSCRRLLKEAGLSYQKPRRSAAEADPEEREEFHEEVKKRRLDATIVCIDQTKTSVKVEPTEAWFPTGERPSIDLSGQRDWTCLLGAVTADGKCIFSRFQEYVTAEHAKHFILALCEEFRDDLVVVLDGAAYFRASAVKDLADRDDLHFVRLPSYAPELNPVEECWRQLEADLGNHYFDSLGQLLAQIDLALDQISVPKESTYF